MGSFRDSLGKPVCIFGRRVSIAEFLVCSLLYKDDNVFKMILEFVQKDQILFFFFNFSFFIFLMAAALPDKRALF